MTPYRAEIGTFTDLTAYHRTADGYMPQVEIVELMSDQSAARVARNMARESGRWVLVWDEFEGAKRGYRADDALAIVDGAWPAEDRELGATREAVALRTLARADAEKLAGRGAVDLWEAGLRDISQIADLTGISRPTVYARLRAAGYEPTNR